MAALATVFLDKRRFGDFVVRDLSASGALLVNGPKLERGVSCRVLLRVPGLGPLELSATTVHSASTASGQHMVGVHFTGLSPEVSDGLRELVDQELERRALPSVLVADDDLQRLSSVAEDLADLGERPLLALTPLEVVHWLCDPDTTVGLALLSENLHTRWANGLFDFVRSEFANVRAVLLKSSLGREEIRELLEWAASPARSSSLRLAQPRPSV